MHKIEEGQVVVSTAGRDEGQCFIVLHTDETYCYLADGNNRRVEKPKKKKTKHLRGTPAHSDEIGRKLLNGDIVINAEIRMYLKLYKENENQM